MRTFDTQYEKLEYILDLLWEQKMEMNVEIHDLLKQLYQDLADADI